MARLQKRKRRRRNPDTRTIALATVGVVGAVLVGAVSWYAIRELRGLRPLPDNPWDTGRRYRVRIGQRLEVQLVVPLPDDEEPFDINGAKVGHDDHAVDASFIEGSMLAGSVLMIVEIETLFPGSVDIVVSARTLQEPRVLKLEVVE